MVFDNLSPTQLHPPTRLTQTLTTQKVNSIGIQVLPWNKHNNVASSQHYGILTLPSRLAATKQKTCVVHLK